MNGQLYVGEWYKRLEFVDVNEVVEGIRSITIVLQVKEDSYIWGTSHMLMVH